MLALPRRVLARPRAGRVPAGVRQSADRGRLSRRADSRGVRRLGARRRPRRRSSSRRSTAAAATPAPATRRCTRWARCCGTARRSRSARSCRRSPAATLRLQAFGVTEPTTGSDTTQHQDDGRTRNGDRYVVRGQKVWISRAEHSDLLLLVARTTPIDAGQEADRRPVDPARRSARSRGRPRPDDPADPHDDEPRDDRAVLRRSRGAGRRAGRRRGQGIPVSARRAERRADPDRGRVRRRRPLVRRARDAATRSDRVVFSRPIGQNQGVQFPIARAHVNVEAADLMRIRGGGAVRSRRAVRRRRRTWRSCSPPTRRGRPPTSCLQTHGGFGFADDYDIERKFRETRLYSGRADLDQPDPRLPGRARARHAALVLGASGRATSGSSPYHRRDE